MPPNAGGSKLEPQYYAAPFVGRPILLSSIKPNIGGNYRAVKSDGVGNRLRATDVAYRRFAPFNSGNRVFGLMGPSALNCSTFYIKIVPDDHLVWKFWAC